MQGHFTYHTLWGQGQGGRWSALHSFFVFLFWMRNSGITSAEWSQKSSEHRHLHSRWRLSRLHLWQETVQQPPLLLWVFWTGRREWWQSPFQSKGAVIGWNSGWCQWIQPLVQSPYIDPEHWGSYFTLAHVDVSSVMLSSRQHGIVHKINVLYVFYWEGR